jgi:hypothetical protein
MPIVIGLANAILWIAGNQGGNIEPTNILLWSDPSGYFTLDASGGYILLS